MIAILIGCLGVSGSVVVLAFVWSRVRGGPIGASMPAPIRNLARFAGGPFSISIAIHLAILLALILAVHESRAREFLILKMDAGSIHEAERFDFPDEPLPDFSTQQKDDLPPVVNTNKVLGTYSSDIAGTQSDTGINLDRHLGNYLNLHPGPGGNGGGGTFPWFIDGLRHKGLDIVLVIDGTKSMDFVMADVKARMTQLAVRVRQLVPIARVGVVVFGGKGIRSICSR
jgi:hypothetical protein